MNLLKAVAATGAAVNQAIEAGKPAARGIARVLVKHEAVITAAVGCFSPPAALSFAIVSALLKKALSK
ncbi:hypothetical protein [Neomegalonema perideroedes]|uniref:hypothetical protein n=1 Tax=Neomegalonema perideroedes TaxID=217219 RepID=UPI0012FE4208|nr:hypothetical protein [Neomegalonema perideroedes]